MTQGKKVDYIFGDLTDVPISDTPSGEIWDFIMLILETSFKILKPTGKFMTHVNIEMEYVKSHRLLFYWFFFVSVGKRCQLSRSAQDVRKATGQAGSAGELHEEQRVHTIVPRRLDLLSNIIQNRQERDGLTPAERIRRNSSNLFAVYWILFVFKEFLWFYSD